MEAVRHAVKRAALLAGGEDRVGASCEAVAARAAASRLATAAPRPLPPGCSRSERGRARETEGGRPRARCPPGPVLRGGGRGSAVSKICSVSP